MRTQAIITSKGVILRRVGLKIAKDPAGRGVRYKLSYGEQIKIRRKPCAVCGELNKRRIVDHCHKTGKVRGALCVSCNVLIGKLENGLQVLQVESFISKLREYLIR